LKPENTGYRHRKLPKQLSSDIPENHGPKRSTKNICSEISEKAKYRNITKYKKF
jgi:hypothetical protein